MRTEAEESLWSAVNERERERNRSSVYRLLVFERENNKGEDAFFLTLAGYTQGAFADR